VVGIYLAFFCAVLMVVVWVASDLILHFSQTWAQVITTGTGSMTFLMVFLIQNTQNRDARAVNLKLNELIRAIRLRQAGPIVRSDSRKDRHSSKFRQTLNLSAFTHKQHS
jgi:low affinity Fe/Cu permease